MDAQPRPVRVLFLYAPRYLNPPWAVCRDVIASLPRHRCEPQVLVDEQAEEVGVPADVPVHRLPLAVSPAGLARRPWSAVSLAASAARAAALVLRERVDVLHANDDASSMLLGVLLARATGRRLVLHFHSRPERSGRLAPARLALFRRGAQAAALCVGCSRFTAGEVGRVLGASRLEVVLNGVDVERFRPGLDRRLRREYGFADDDVVVLELGRLQKSKRQEDLIRALAIARRRAPRLKALLVGWPDPRYAGPFASYQDELRLLIAAQGLEGQVVLGKARPEAPLLHAASDVGVLPSEREAFGLVLAEAMACGRPVVGADAGGIPELFEAGASGLLVPLGQPERLAEALVTLADDRVRAAMGEAARQRALAALDARTLGPRFATLYEGVLRGH